MRRQTVFRSSVIGAIALTSLAGAARAQIGVLHPLALPQGGERLLNVSMSRDLSSAIVSSSTVSSPYTTRAVVHRIDSAVSTQLGIVGTTSGSPLVFGGLSYDGSGAFWTRFNSNDRTPGGAFVWRDGLAVTELPQLVPTTYLNPNSISADGNQVIGWTEDMLLRARAVAWTASHGSFFLAEPAGTRDSGAAFFTDDGKVWGSVSTATNSWFARWTLNGNSSSVELISEFNQDGTSPYLVSASRNGKIFYGHRYISPAPTGPRRPLRSLGGPTSEIEMLPFPEGFDIVNATSCSADGTEAAIVSIRLTPSPILIDTRIWSQRFGLETAAQYLTRRGANLNGWTEVSVSMETLGENRFAGSGVLNNGPRTAFYVDLFPICKADLANTSGEPTPDSAVTIDDLLFFLAAFENGTTAADIDDGLLAGDIDGAVTIDDLLYYLVRFENGC